MNNHPTFITQQRISDGVLFHDAVLKQYPDGTFRVVGYDILPGLQIFCGTDVAGKKIYHPIDKIIDERPSSGTFDNYNRPTSYLVTVIPAS